MTPPDATRQHAQTARDTGLACALPCPVMGPGMAAPALMRVRGSDAASFLHSQLTNDVEGLQAGAGNLQARVQRTGHLQHYFSLHRDPADPEAFVAVAPSERIQALHDDLDSFLFADDVTMAVDVSQPWVVVQGPQAAAALDAVFGPVGFEPWDALPEGAMRRLTRTRSTIDAAVPHDALVFRRSLTGDVGFLLTWPAGAEATALVDALKHAAASYGIEVLTPDAWAAAWQILRIEAGQLHLEADLTGKRRLLPETGVEQRAVSYTKGCYLGQEVIARVRTYGSVPHLLRALVLDADTPLDVVPEVGEPLVDATTGKRVGHAMSRTWSPVAEAGVVMAYLSRDSRTPDTRLRLEGPNGPFEATVALLPLYHAADTGARVQQLYDRAVRTFASGDEDRALTMMLEALSLDASFADGYEAIGVMLGRAGRFHEAIDVFRRLEEVAPDEPLVNTNLSLYYMKLGDKETAEDEAGKATLKSMAKARGTSIAATVDEDLAKAKRQDATRKKTMFAKVLAFDPVDPIALFGMGNAQLVLEEYEQAAEVLARAIDVDATNSPVYAAHGKALEGLGRYADAQATYTKGVEVASRKGDLMPLKEMQHRLLLLGGAGASAS